MSSAQPLWTVAKDTLVRAGLEPWLRPILDAVRGRARDADHVAALRVIATLGTNACCVDIGCHKGLYLDPMRLRAKTGRFYAFEPVPYLFNRLRDKYRRDSRVRVFNCALSATSGAAELFVNQDDMGLSGLSRRTGRSGMNSVRPVSVPLRTLDEVLGDQAVDFDPVRIWIGRCGLLRCRRRLDVFVPR